jgi:hypothetical protein
MREVGCLCLHLAYSFLLGYSAPACHGVVHACLVVVWHSVGPSQRDDYSE